MEYGYEIKYLKWFDTNTGFLHRDLAIVCKQLTNQKAQQSYIKW